MTPPAPMGAPPLRGDTPVGVGGRYQPGMGEWAAQRRQPASASINEISD